MLQRSLKAAILVVFVVAVCCLTQNSGEWSINMKYTASSKSRFYVLHDWKSTFSQDKATPFPAAKTSDVMLKTMGIMKDGSSWSGVQMKNMFSRPLATALFVMDGLSSEYSFDDLSKTSFEVDQTGLTGCTCKDTSLLFQGDNVVTHMSDLFDGMSQTSSVSASVEAAHASAANGRYTTEEQVTQLMDDIKKGKASLSKYGLDAAAAQLDMTNEVDTKFLAELLLVKQMVEQLQELKSYVADNAPDVFVFTLTTVESMEKKYAAKSNKMALVTELVKKVIQESTKTLVSVYNGKVLVQALVLQWEKPAVDKTSHELDEVFAFVRPYLVHQDRDSFLNSLRKLELRESYKEDSYICWNIKQIMDKGTKFYAVCPLASSWQNNGDMYSHPDSNMVRKKRQTEDNYNLGAASNLTVTSNFTVPYLVENRTNVFSAIFLIVLFVTLSFGLAIFAVSWAMWTMDPGDSIIYRQVSDPTGRM